MCLLSLTVAVFAYVLLSVCRNEHAVLWVMSWLVSASLKEPAGEASLEEQSRPRQTAHLLPGENLGWVLSFYTDKSEASGITVLSSQGRHY